MSLLYNKQILVIPALLLAGILSSCANQGSTTANGPHATVHMRDGTHVSGTISASSPDGLTLMGDDRVSHTISMAQVRSVTYDQEQPLATSGGAVADSAPRDSSPQASAPRVSAPRESSARDRSAREYAVRDEEVHEDHYHPPRTAIQSKTYTLPSGAEIPVRTEETIDAAVATGGQTYAAEVTRDVLDDSGAVVIPHGSNAQIIIRSATRGSRLKGVSDLVLDLDSVSVEGRLYRLETQDIVRRGRDGVGRNRRTAEYTGGGAALGAIIGAIAGGGRGAAIGAASGAGAGAGTQIVTKGGSIRVPAETILTFQLASPLQVRAAN